MGFKVKGMEEQHGSLSVNCERMSVWYSVISCKTFNMKICFLSNLIIHVRERERGKVINMVQFGGLESNLKNGQKNGHTKC